MATRLALLGLLCVCMATSASAFVGDETLTGQVKVLDGDTLEFTEGRVRIYGIDAPEGAQTCKNERGPWRCGRTATSAVERLTRGRTVACKGQGVDAYGRLLAVCVADRVDLGAALVKQGLAWAFIKYSTMYEREETQARAAALGVFAAENQPPWEFRAMRWEGAKQTAEADRARDCPIKGNISRDGGRIYHLPWQSSYAATKITAKTGERWFCTAAEAEKAGWRVAR